MMSLGVLRLFYLEMILSMISVKAVSSIPFLTPTEYEKPFIFQTAR